MNKCEKFLSKSILALYFRVGIFYFASPCVLILHFRER